MHQNSMTATLNSHLTGDGLSSKLFNPGVVSSRSSNFPTGFLDGDRDERRSLSLLVGVTDEWGISSGWVVLKVDLGGGLALVAEGSS